MLAYHLLRTAPELAPRCTADPGCCCCAGAPGCPPGWSSGIFIAWVTAFISMSPRGIRYIHWYQVTFQMKNINSELHTFIVYFGKKKSYGFKDHASLYTHIFSPKGPLYWLYTLAISLLPTKSIFSKYWSSAEAKIFVELKTRRAH